MIGLTTRVCAQQIMLAMWRRKPMLIAVVFGISVFVVFLQYNSVGGQNDGLARDDGQAMAGHELPLGMAGNSRHRDKSLLPNRDLSGMPNRKDNEQTLYRMNDKGPIREDGSNAGNFQSQNIGQERQQQLQAQQPPANSRNYVPQRRLVHLDLKGAPPKISYMKQIFPMFKDAGATGILLEYEDMFPYWGTIAPIAAKNAFSKEDVNTILELAKENDLDVIPLVQTFGHMEFVLKLKEFRHLREIDDHPTAVCPSKNDSFTLVTTIIDQVMQLHPNVKWLHIGSDEVFHLGYCNKCVQKDRDDLFLGHVSKVARYVKEKHHVVPIIWDDMLRQMSTEKLKQHDLGNLVEPMIWTYVRDVYRFITYNNWVTYSEVFERVWAASSFKGAYGETLTVPNSKMHLENNEGWLEVMSEQHLKFKSFQGIVITGWQRYDHFAALCELLPSGMPSLILNLLAVTNGAYSSKLQSKFHSIMRCTHSRTQIDLEADPYLWQKGYGCFFPGSSVFRMTQFLSETVKKTNDYLYDITISKAWLTDYNIRRNFTQPYRVDNGLEEHSSTMYSLTSLVRQARDALREVFDDYTVAEWIEQNVYPYILKMEKLWKDSLELKKAKTWPQRPLPPLEDLKRFSVGLGEQDNTRP